MTTVLMKNLGQILSTPLLNQVVRTWAWGVGMIEYKYAKSPTGMQYIELIGNLTYRNFPEFADAFFEILKPQAGKYESVNVVDMHWYSFTWKDNKYCLIFEDFPYEVSIEKDDEKSDLSLIYQFLESLTKQSNAPLNFIIFSKILPNLQRN